jgi:protein-S-isoprenylcysteine O-methyltransferase Ste14
MEHVLEWSVASVVFWVTTVAWLVEPLVFASSGRGVEVDRRSRAERLLITGGIATAIAVAAVFDRAGIGDLSGAGERAMRVAGLVLYATGAMLRYLAASALGAAFTRDVRVEREQPLVERGPYRGLRHPLYAGLFALALGLVMQYGNVAAAAIGAVAVALPLAARARREERLLHQALPGRYELWCASRHRILPGLF